MLQVLCRYSAVGWHRQKLLPGVEKLATISLPYSRQAFVGVFILGHSGGISMDQ